MAIPTKIVWFSCTNFPIILLILALTSHTLLHINDREFCQHDNLMSTIKINRRKIRLKSQKDFTVRQGDFSYWVMCVHAYTNTQIHTHIYTHKSVFTYNNPWILRKYLKIRDHFSLERLINILKSFNPLFSLSHILLSSDS